MNLALQPLLNFINDANLETLKLGAIIYVGLLWLSIIIWVTRDSIQRSDSLLFQVFAILLNIIIPLLGALLYLILRPGKTNTDRYYEELEHRLLLESIKETKEEEEKTPKKKNIPHPPREKAKHEKAEL